jgi:aldehyde:ferredoxin oxidoreductase
MAIQGGYQGKLLDVDLTNQRVQAVPLPSEEVLRAWIGGTGLGLYLLAGQMTAGMKTTDPEAPVIIMTGPLTGTLVTSSSNWTMINLRYKPDFVVGLSQAHGWFGARLKHAGWDGIIIRGSSKTPVYLWIDDGQAELRDAGRYWGEDTYETPRRLKLELGDPLNISVACIGPGGENLVLGASVRADGVYTCAMGDAGMAWGSKKLKAIAVRGAGRVPVANMAAFMDVCTEWRDTLYAQPEPPPSSQARFKGIAEWGKFGGIPVKNFTEPESAGAWCDSLKQDLAKWKIRPVGSWQCDMACHHETVVTTGPLAGSTAAGFGAEVFEEVGPNVGIMDAGTSMAIAGLVDGLGIHSGEVPRAIAMLMEGFNTGRVSLEDTEGIDLTWGNHEAVIDLLHKAAQREGIGNILADGMRETGLRFGIEDLAVHMRGVGFQGHDFRHHPVALFSKHIVSQAGSAPQFPSGLYRGSAARANSGEPDIGYTETLPLDIVEGVGEPTFKGQCLKLWRDCIGVCEFAMGTIEGNLDLNMAAIDAAVGWDPLNRAEALLVGERVVNLQRLIAFYRGYQPESDFDISERLLSLPSGPASGQASNLGPHLEKWRGEYYRAAGWDPDTGQPSSETLQRVGLGGFGFGGKLS